jgi:hypothetical protein
MTRGSWTLLYSLPNLGAAVTSGRFVRTREARGRELPEWTFVRERRNVEHMSEGAVAQLQEERGADGLRRWWRAHFGGIDRKEAWGYGVWGFFGLTVFVPEIWAAKWGASAKWPTVSATVGELEYWHTEVALAVVALIALSAYSAFRYPPERTGVLATHKGSGGEQTPGSEGDPLLPNRTPKGGRLTRSSDPLPEIGTGLYFAGAAAVIALGTLIAALTTDVTEEHTVGRTLYGLTALFWIAIPAALAWPKKWGREIPFPTLFETMRSLERRLRVVALAVAAGLAILLIHLVFYPWPSTIPDIQDLHRQYEQQGPRHQERPPEPTTP